MRTVFTVPGISNSGPDHWQSRWERQHPAVQRIQQHDWDQPVASHWIAGIDAAVRAQTAPPVVVAHSLGCLATVMWAAMSDAPLRGLLLVAPPDPAGLRFPIEAKGFGSLPHTLRAREVTIVSSVDDPYSDHAFVLRCVRAWRAEHVALQRAGHINAASGLGDWPEGWRLVERWRG
jgi:predicted alpha/beta hydrolase family esterase